MLTDDELRAIRAEWTVFNDPADVAASQVLRLLDEIERLRNFELAQVKFERDRRYYIQVTLRGQTPIRLNSGDSIDIATKSDGAFWIRFAQKPVALSSDAEVVTKLLRAIGGFERVETLDPHVMLRVLKGIIDPNYLDSVRVGGYHR